MQPLQCLQHAYRNLPDIVLNSGRTLFRLGKYNECLATPDMDYFFLQLGAKGQDATPYFYGACLPQMCSNTTIRSLLNVALEGASLPLEVKKVQHHINEYEYPYTLPFFLTFALIFVLVALVLVATCSSNSRKTPLLSSFSIQQSSKIFHYREGSRLNVLNGIRSLSMFWVIYGHTMSSYIGYSSNIMTIQKNVLEDWKFLTVEAGLYSVDVFFFVGGFLLAYAFLKEKATTKMKYLLAAINRILRLLPSYFMAIMIYYAVFPHLGSGPFWQSEIVNSEACHTLWRPLLFVDNFVDNGMGMCMGWGWYLQNDIQLFFFCLFLLLVYSKSKFWSFLLIFLSMAANFAFVMTHTYDNKEKWLTHIADTANSAQYQLDIYFKPWGRCPPYLYGLLLGILYFEFLQYETKSVNKGEKTLFENQVGINGSQVQMALSKQQEISQEQDQIPFLYKVKCYFEENPWKRRLIESFGLAFCLFISFIPRTNQGDSYWPQFIHSFYLTYGKLAFVFGLSLIILPSLLLAPSKNGSTLLVHFLMDTKIFSYIAKISFWTYLIHLTILLLAFGSTKIDFYYAMTPAFVLFVSFSVMSMLSGTVFFYLVEAPFSKIQKSLLTKLQGKRRKGSQVNSKKQDTNPKQINQQQKLMEKKLKGPQEALEKNQ